jgi:YVTN family beta-propeller protein
MHPFKSFGLTFSGLSPSFFRLFPRLALMAFLVAGLGGQASARPFAYVALGGNKVAVLDIATNFVVQEVTVGNSPQGVAVSPSGRFVYVANVGSHNVSVIDTQTNVVSSTFTPMSTNGLPYGIAVHPTGNRLYVTNWNGQSLSVIDPASGLPLAQIPLVNPRAIAVSPTGSFAYVSQAQPSAPRTVAVVDLQQNRVVAEVPMNLIGNIVFSPDGSRAYFAEGVEVVVVNTANHTIISRWPLTQEGGLTLLSSIAISADGSRLYAVTTTDKRLNTIDTATGSVISRFTFENEPTSLVVNSAQQVAILFGERTGLSTSVNLNTGAVMNSVSISSPKVYGTVVTNGATQIDNGGVSGGGGGCGYISGSGGPPDPTLPTLAVLALLTLALRKRARQR